MPVVDVEGIPLGTVEYLARCSPDVDGGPRSGQLKRGRLLSKQEEVSMAAKMIAFNTDARDALKAGVDALADAIKVTLGPRGRTVAIDRKWGLPTVINSGVVVAREIELPDPLQNMGAQLLKQAAIKTSEVAGDGTTTSTILAQAIVTEGLRNLAAGANPPLWRHSPSHVPAAVSHAPAIRHDEPGAPACPPCERPRRPRYPGWPERVRSARACSSRASPPDTGGRFQRSPQPASRHERGR
jgi:hypothetical protein